VGGENDLGSDLGVDRPMSSRRSFLHATLAAGASLMAPLATAKRVVAQPARRTIVDAQVHLWKAETPDWKWVPGLPPQLPEPMTIERLVPLMDEAGVDRAPFWRGCSGCKAPGLI
jgi:hypothetical protein